MQVVGEVGPKFAADLSRDLNRAVQGIKVDASPIADGIGKGAKDGAAQADRVFDRLADQLSTTFADIGHDADRAFDHVASDAAVAGEKVGHRFQAAGEVSERALQELDRTAGREFQSIANKAGASAAATSTKWVAAWSVIKGAALAATTAMVAGLTAVTVFGLKSAAALEQTQIGLVSLLGSAEAANSFIKELQQFAAATPFEFADVADASRRILAFGASVGIARKQVIPTLTTIGDLVSVLGGTSENIQSVIRALGQMASKGKVSQEEILQLAEALPGFNANAAIASSLGLSVADTLKLITAGGVSAKVGIDALLKGMANFPGAAGAMAKQAQTLNGVFSTFKDTIAIALTDAFTPVIPQIKETLTQITPVIGDAVRIIAPALGGLLTKILPLVAEAIKVLAPLTGILTDLAGTLLTALSPGLAALGGVATRLVDALAPLVVALGDALGAALVELVNSGALDEIIKQLVEMTPALLDLLVALVPLLPPLAQLLALVFKMQTPLIQLLALVTDLIAVKALTPAVKAVADAVNKLFKVLGPGIDFFTNIRNWPRLFKATMAKIGPIFDDVASSVGDFFAKIGHFFAELPGQVGRFLAALPGEIVGAIRAAFVAAAKALLFGIGVLIGEVLAAPHLIGQALDALPGLLADVLSRSWDVITTGFDIAWRAVTSAAQAIPGLIGSFLAGIPLVIGAIFDAAKDVVRRDIDGILSFVFSIPGRISALAGEMAKAGLALIKGFFAGLSSTGGFVGDLASSIASSIKGLLNKVIASINQGIASVDEKLPGISLPRIPQLAAGGLTTGGGLANLHPRELVLPLEDRRAVNLLSRALSTAAQNNQSANALAGDGGAGSIEVRVFIGESELTDIVNVVVRERDRKTKARVKAGAGVRR